MNFSPLAPDQNHLRSTRCHENPATCRSGKLTHTSTLGSILACAPHSISVGGLSKVSGCRRTRLLSQTPQAANRPFSPSEKRLPIALAGRFRERRRAEFAHVHPRRPCAGHAVDRASLVPCCSKFALAGRRRESGQQSIDRECIYLLSTAEPSAPIFARIKWNRNLFLSKAASLWRVSETCLRPAWCWRACASHPPHVHLRDSRQDFDLSRQISHEIVSVFKRRPGILRNYGPPGLGARERDLLSTLMPSGSLITKNLAMR